MKLDQVTDDLRKPGGCQSLYEEIKAYGIWCHALQSTWVIATNQAAAQVRDKLQAVMDADDGLSVTRLHGYAAWRGLTDEKKWRHNPYQLCAA